MAIKADRMTRAIRSDDSLAVTTNLASSRQLNLPVDLIDAGDLRASSADKRVHDSLIEEWLA
jgi:hypothetical protein